MISQKMYELGSKRSVIREIFEFGKKRAAEIGAENVFDFSLGNPSVPAPSSVQDAIREILDTESPIAIHSYTSAQGDAGVRKAIADSLNRRFGTAFHADNFYMTVGAAASLNICFRALTVPGDEMITFAPFFPEYQCFVEAQGAALKVVPAQVSDFQIDFAAFEELLNEHTKAIIVNSPNNPCGVVYTEETIERLAELLEKKEEEYGHPIYLISDEPYREIVYGETPAPFLTKYYKDTLICYSYSKSLSLPGERIGYVLVPDEAADAKRVYAAVCGAGRALGYVCAPSLFQKVVAKCEGQTGDIETYRKNRDLLYNALTEYGFSCVKPEGAFYLFPKALEEDAYAFCERAKKYNLLLVPGDDFGCKGHIRISYCVSTEMIKRALPAFKALADEYKIQE